MVPKYLLVEPMNWRVIQCLEARQKFWTILRRLGLRDLNEYLLFKINISIFAFQDWSITACRINTSIVWEFRSKLIAATVTVVSRQRAYSVLNEKALYPMKPQVCVSLISQRKSIALNGINSIRIGVNTNGLLFSLLMSRGWIQYQILSMLRSEGSQKCGISFRL